MNTKEIHAGNFAEAMLRAALLLGNLHRTGSIRRVFVYAATQDNDARKGALQCVISMTPASVFNPCRATNADHWEDYDIIFPMYTPRFH